MPSRTRQTFRVVTAAVIGLSLFGALFVLHLQVMAMRSDMAGHGVRSITMGNPANPTCHFRVEGDAIDMQALSEAGLWRAIAACEAEQIRRRGTLTAPPSGTRDIEI